MAHCTKLTCTRSRACPKPSNRQAISQNSSADMHPCWYDTPAFRNSWYLLPRTNFKSLTCDHLWMSDHPGTEVEVSIDVNVGCVQHLVPDQKSSTWKTCCYSMQSHNENLKLMYIIILHVQEWRQDYRQAMHTQIWSILTLFSPVRQKCSNQQSTS